MSIFYTRHDGGVTIFKDGKHNAVSNTHQNFDKIIDALKNKKFDDLESLMSIAKTIDKTGVSKKKPGQKVFVRNGKIYFTDTKNRKEVLLNGTLVDRILQDIGKPSAEKYADSLMSLLENIQKNTSKDIAGELYEWLASGKAPITSDGCILAYKKVRPDFNDIYTGTMNNAPGKVVRMKQSDVDSNRKNECSHGLHFATLGYLSYYGNTENSKIVIVKVNPRHIFAIPTDYQCQKGRASEYYVVGEYKSKDREVVEAFSDSFVDEDNKETSAPNVEFTKSGLRPSLESLAESYNLVKHGKVKVANLPSGKVILDWTTNTGNNLHNVTDMSFATKSVRKLVKAAIEKLQK